MGQLVRIYNAVIVGMAMAACGVIAGILFLITYDVVARSIGLPLIAATVAFGEYGLLLFTMLAAPYLVRTNAHVYVELIIRFMSPPLWRLDERLVYLICLGMCAFITVFAAELAWFSFVRGEVDFRTVDIPGWVQYGILCLGFFFMFIEFVRYLFGIGTMYPQLAGDRDRDLKQEWL